MKPVLSAILILVFSSNAFGQEKSVFRLGSDTSFWYRYLNGVVVDFGEKNTQSFPESRVFRLSNIYTILTLTKDNGIYKGYLSFFATETGTKGPGKKFKKDFLLSETVVQAAFQYIDSFNIDKVPSQKFIPAWKQGFDGVEYLIDEKIDSVFSFRTYWTPSAQNCVPEAELLTKFLNELDRIIDRKQLSGRFQESIPFDSWTYPGASFEVIRVNRTSTKKPRGKSH